MSWPRRRSPKARQKKTGTRTRWLPDLDVFTDIAIPSEYFTDVMKRQAVVNEGITFRFRSETALGQFEETDFLYENGIMDYVPGACRRGDPDRPHVLAGGEEGPGPGGQAGVQGQAQRGHAAFPTG